MSREGVLVFNRMGGDNWDKIQAGAAKMWKGKEEVLLGDIEWGTCLHRGILSQVLSPEAGLDTVLNKNLITEEFKSPVTGIVMEVPESPHTYNLLFMQDGKIIIFDTKNLAAIDERKNFENYLGNFDYPEFKKAKKEFPLFGSNKAPFLEARWGVDGLEKLIESEVPAEKLSS